jgi:hypothetical protein
MGIQEICIVSYRKYNSSYVQQKVVALSETAESLNTIMGTTLKHSEVPINCSKFFSCALKDHWDVWKTPSPYTH